MKKKIIKKEIGFGLVEVVISAAIMSVGFVAILNAFSFFLKAENDSVKYVQSSYLLEEGMEVSRYWRDTSWSNISSLATGTTYYFSSSASTSPVYQIWKATTTKSSIFSNFTRTLVLADVRRNITTMDIATTGAIDSNIRQVTVAVSWLDTKGATTTKSLTTYLTNLYDN